MVEPMSAGGGDAGDGPVQTGRGRGRVGLVVLAALVALALLAVPLVLSVVRDDADQPETAADPPEAVVQVGEEWRTETWHHVEVRVPADWAVGGSPIRDGGSAGLVDCGVGGWVDREQRPDLPYVGRPVRLSDTCRPQDPDALPVPRASYVWFDSPVPVGTSSAGDGFDAETVATGGVRVTVVTDDAALRAEIVASVGPSAATDANGCPAVQPRIVVPVGEVRGEQERLSVCVYEGPEAGRALLWSGERDGEAAVAFAAALEEESEDGWCSRRRVEPRLVLHLQSEDALATYLVDLRCGEIRMPASDGRDRPAAPLQPATVEPWALDGAVLYAPLGM